MRFFCDIDGVLSRGNPRNLSALLNAMLKLGIEEVEREHTETFHAFDQHPIVQAYISQIGEAAFAQRKAVIGLAPNYLLTCQVIQEAVEGIASLSSKGAICYCTCRKTEKASFNELVAQSTRTWLATSGFTNPDHVFFCRTITEKLEIISDQIAGSGEQAILIEDQYHKILAAIPTLSQPRQEILRHAFILWAFGITPEDLPRASNHLAAIHALPSWSSLTEAMASINTLIPVA
jgi:beta-phosphoglucomutase-like phosphatase (HAD superfamily)